MKDQIRGKAEEVKGKLTGDRKEELKGQARQKVGDAKQGARDIEGEVKKAARRRKSR